MIKAMSVSSTDASELTSREYGLGHIRHIVLFRYKPGTADEVKSTVAARFLSMKQTATRSGDPYIVSIEVGPQISQEGLGNGFEQGFIVTFQSEGDRNYYVGEPFIRDPAYFDPVHAEFKSYVGPLLDADGGCLVFDFRVRIN
jgi:hypothetical protein